jgi:hypothetical protein
MTGPIPSPPWGSQLLAALLLLACVGAMAWMLIGERRRQHLRAWATRLRAVWKARPWRQAPAPDSRQAQRDAEALIERVRRRADVQREGNVLRPERFRRDTDAGDSGDRGPDDPPRPTLH